MFKIFTLIIIYPFLTLAQDSPMQAAPGSGPPPQGWTQQAPPNGGIHLPDKAPKKKYKLKMGATVDNPKAASTPTK